MSLAQNERTDLAYYIKGKEIGIVSGNSGLSVQKDATDEILVEFTEYDFDAIVDELYDIPLVENEKQAVVYWMKHKYFEMTGDVQRSVFFKNRFFEFITELRVTYGETPTVAFHSGPTAMMREEDDPWP